MIASREGPIQWKTFASPPIPSIPIIPDAVINTDIRTHFLEMDLGTEPLSIWTRKAAQYLKLAMTAAFHEITPHPMFSVLVVATCDTRLEQLRRHISKQTQKLFWFTILSTIQKQGFGSPVWLRPKGEILSLPGA